MRTLLCILSLFVLAGCAFVKVNVPSGPGEVEEHVVEGKGKAKIAVLDISGIISLTPIGLDRFGKEPAMVPRLREELQWALEDERVVGVVVRIDSPGGSVSASDILYHELKSFREKKKVPLLACFVDKGFSGGYYAAMGADEIWAHPTAVVGGVGVITFKLDVSELLDSWGVKLGVVKSGPEKDFWSPLRPASPEEQAVMQGIVDRLHRRFLGIVQENRHLSPCVLDQIARGGVFSAEPARDMGLIDSVGYLEEAIARVRELAGVDEARVIIYRRSGTQAETIYSAGTPLLQGLSALERGAAEMLTPSFRYQYLP